MTTFDIGNNTKAVILSGILLVGVIILFMNGKSTSDISSLVSVALVIMGGAGLAISEKVSIKNDSNEDEPK